MRRTLSLTSPERWELGLFLAMLMAGLLCVAAIMKVDGLPKLTAFWNEGSQPKNSKAIPTVEILSGASQALSLGNSSVPTRSLAVTRVPAPAIVAPAAPTPAAPPAPAAEYKWYNGKKFVYVRTLRLRVTAYAPDPRCCYPYDGTTTASGLSVKTNGGRLVAADTSLIPMHSLVSIPGYSGSTAVPVLDRGGDIKGHRMDVLLPTFEEAKVWGSRLLDVKIYQPVK